MSNRTPLFLIGLGIGAVTGLMLAPKPGDETRADLRDAAENAADKGRELVETHRGTIESALEAGVSAYRSVAGGRADGPLR